jgi:hypothetical protein
MNYSGNFNIRVFDSLIVTNLTGEWSQQDDLSYVASLAEKIDQLQRNPWGILVDMRGWIVHEGYIQPTFNITLDRFNQKAECWIVDNMQQGEFLLPYFQDVSFKPVKFLNPSDAKTYIENSGFDLSESDILIEP